MMCQSVAVSVSTINTHTVTTASCSSVVYPVARGISQWRGRSPGDSDTSGTIRLSLQARLQVACLSLGAAFLALICCYPVTTAMETALLLPLLLLVTVNCQQTFPYVSFMGQTLDNHSYVDISTVGSESDNSVVCHTDLSTCCSGSQGIHRGDWSFPDGTVLPFSGDSVPIGLGRRSMIAVIRRTNDATGPTGIYRCRIATNSNSDESVGETVYVGLYPTIGGKLKHRLAADINLPIVLV